MPPKVSVVIPSYNHAAYIRRAAESVLAQTLADLELIIVDDGSTDDSLQALAGIADRRMTVVAQENRGAHAAINRGLGMARGAYLSILNSDDAYHPERLACLTAVLEADPSIGLAGSYITVMDVGGKFLGVKQGYADLSPWELPHPERSFRAGDDLHAALLTENYFATTSNYVFPRAAWRQAGDFLSLRYAHDWDFALRVARQYRLHLQPQPLMEYRVHPGNTIRENKAAMVFEICWVLARHLPHTPADPARLLHSIHTFGCDRVLNALLARSLHADDRLSLALLQRDNPERQIYLAYIGDCLDHEPSAAESLWQKMKGWLK
jgi:glycosyltransferase involved in cell wall biosynthesis